MTFQLRQMVLINAGTNKFLPSNRITSIDPRGGAAVVGENGVGKTTTLRILPLFFGHLPSQIVSSGQGQDPMIRFILPTDASAIVFEYQRGSDKEEDLRLAVIRRRSDDSDAPEYRLYRCGFRKELFVTDGHFLTDEETQKQASALGILTTSKLSTADYRSVILKTSANSKDKDRLRRYSLDWSFGPKQLDNLDRLVAAMVKKHINFADIVQVAVGMVQHDLGLGADRAKLSIKQGRAPIERWLANRSACAEALKLAPRVEALEFELKAHRGSVSRFRELRADVRLTSTARKDEMNALIEEIDGLEKGRVAVQQEETQKRSVILGLCAQANSTAGTTKQAFDAAAGDQAFFESERASFWESQVQELPTLRLQKKAIDDQVAAAVSASAQASAHYATLINTVKQESSDRLLELELAKDPHRTRCDASLQSIDQSEQQALGNLQTVDKARRDQLTESIEPLIELRGVWESRQKTPQVSHQLLKALADANARLLKHTQDTAEVRLRTSRSESKTREAQQQFQTRESELTTAKSDVQLAALALANVRERLNPSDGTLQSALRAHGDEAWKKTLAKVINPDLLNRNDLDPQALEDASESMYGWQINTGVITAPDWTNDETMRQSVDQAVSRHEAAQAHQAKVQELLAADSRKLADAQHAELMVQARLAVLDGQTETIKTDVGLAGAAIETERKSAQGIAATELSRIRVSIDEIKGQLNRHERESNTHIAEIKANHTALRKGATTRRDAAIADVEAGITAFRNATADRIRGIDKQLEDHLSKSGVDVGHLNALKAEAAETEAAVAAREAKESLVKRWQEWVRLGGAGNVESLKSKAVAAVEAARVQSQNLADFDGKAEKTRGEYTKSLGLKTKRKDDVDGEIAILEGLDIEFGEYNPHHASQIDTKIPARDLRAKVQNEKKELSTLESEIGNMYASIRFALTSKNSAVKELIDASMEMVSERSDIGRAGELCTCFKMIGPQIVTDVNATLRTLLSNVGAFQGAIVAFENEVAAFNKRLQDGLSSVHCFERINDLKLHIVTNFEGLGFYKKLSKMQDVVRQHQNEFGKDNNRDLPPDETVRALSDFFGAIGQDGSLEINLSAHITIKGSLTDNGKYKEFKRASELEDISSEGLTTLILITLLTALLNTIRKGEAVHVPWVTDEVSKFDKRNFAALMKRLKDNHIDVVTASPELGVAQLSTFANHYLFEDLGRIRKYTPASLAPTLKPTAALDVK